MAVRRIFQRLDLERIHEAEVDDVHGDFRIENFLEAFPDGFVGRLAGVASMFGSADGTIGVRLAFVLGGIRRDFFAKRVGIRALDAEHTGVADDGEVAAEAVRDGDLGAGRQHGRITRGNDGGLHVTREDAVVRAGRVALAGGVVAHVQAWWNLRRSISRTVAAASSWPTLARTSSRKPCASSSWATASGMPRARR